jgi:hypothetical protein
MKALIVTRHSALVTYLREIFPELIDADVITHVTTDDQVEGRYVYGVLPLRLARLALTVTEVPLELPQSLRGTELSLEQVRQYAGAPVEYHVRTPEELLEGGYCVYGARRHLNPVTYTSLAACDIVYR